MRAKTNVTEIAVGVLNDLDEIRAMLPPGAEDSEAWKGIETFAALALRIIAKTNPSKVRSEAMTLSIQTLIPPGERKA